MAGQPDTQDEARVPDADEGVPTGDGASDIVTFADIEAFLDSLD